MSPDAAAVLSGLVGAADDDVLDFIRIKRALLNDLGNDRSQHVVRPHTGERAGVTAKWGAQSGVDIPVEHDRFLLAPISSCPRAAVKPPGSTTHRSLGPQADALAQVAVGQLSRIGDMRAGGLNTENHLGDRLKMRAEMDRRFEREYRDFGRLDPDMAEHLLVDRLDAAAREHRRDPALLVGHQGDWADPKFCAAIHRPRAGEDATGELAMRLRPASHRQSQWRHRYRVQARPLRPKRWPPRQPRDRRSYRSPRRAPD